MQERVASENGDAPGSQNEGILHLSTSLRFATSYPSVTNAFKSCFGRRPSRKELKGGQP